MPTKVPNHYSFDVTFKIGDTEYPVSTITLEAALNGIPTATLQVISSAPKDNIIDGIEQTDTLSDLVSACATITEKAEGWVHNPTKCYLKIVTTYCDSQGKEHTTTIDLKGWILVSAGMDTTIGSGVQVVMQHPAVKLTAGYAYVPSTIRVKPPNVKILAGSSDNVLHLFQNYMKAVIGTMNPADYTVDAVEKSYGALWLLGKDLVRELANPKLIKWHDKAIGYPVESPVLKVGIAASIKNLISPEGNSLSALLTQYLTAVVAGFSGTFDNKPLVCYPTSPWGKSTFKIRPSDLVSLRIPGVDAHPVSSVYCIGSMSGSPYGMLPVNKGTSTNEVKISGGYFEYKDIPGTPQGVAPPMWHMATTMREVNRKENLAEGNQDKPVTKVDPKRYAYSVNKSVKAYTHDMFFQKCREHVILSLEMRFMAEPTNGRYKDPIGGSNLLRPGVCASVVDSKKDGTIFTGMVEAVRHTIDAQSRVASTSVSMSHARPTGTKGLYALTNVANATYNFKFEEVLCKHQMNYTLNG